MITYTNLLCGNFHTFPYVLVEGLFNSGMILAISAVHQQKFHHWLIGH